MLGARGRSLLPVAGLAQTSDRNLRERLREFLRSRLRRPSILCVRIPVSRSLFGMGGSRRQSSSARIVSEQGEVRRGCVISRGSRAGAGQKRFHVDEILTGGGVT